MCIRVRPVVSSSDRTLFRNLEGRSGYLKANSWQDDVLFSESENTKAIGVVII